MHRMKFYLFFVACLAALFYWIFEGSSKYPRPTADYYINDYADVLFQATRETITNEGDRLFDVTKDEVDGGSQVVFATFVVETLSEIAEYDKTEIYREWKIGKDDMGVLVLLFFMPSETDDTDNYVQLDFIEVQVETGYRMEQYLTPTELGLIIDDTIMNDEWDYLIDMAVVHMLYELLTVIYVDIYDYDSFNYDMDEYYEYLMDYVPSGDTSLDETSAMGFIAYLLSPYSSFWDKFITALPLMYIFLYGGGIGIMKAGGGSSGGMGIFRRKR